MSVKSERKKRVKAEKQEQKAATDGYLVRKKYPQSDSDEWFYFADELEVGYMWTPDSAIETGKATVFVFSTQQAAQRKAREIEKYHEWRRKQGNASGADVSVVKLSEVFPNARLSEVPNAVTPQPQTASSPAA